MAEMRSQPHSSVAAELPPGKEGRARSALMLALPELESLTGVYRRRYTADGAVAPPHITLMYPFFAPDEITPALLRRVARAVASVSAFGFALSRVASFPQGVVYLAPDPAAPLVALITRLRRAFPEIASYWDEYDQVVPHLTVADQALTDRTDLPQEIEAALAGRLPVRCRADEAVLFQQLQPAPAPWTEHTRFPLALNETRAQ